jgi:hypothetical protein
MHAVTSPAYVPAPVTDRQTALTPRGAVAVMIIRLERELEALPSADRAYIASMLRDLIEDATA